MLAATGLQAIGEEFLDSEMGKHGSYDATKQGSDKANPAAEWLERGRAW